MLKFVLIQTNSNPTHLAFLLGQIIDVALRLKPTGKRKPDTVSDGRTFIEGEKVGRSCS